MKLFAIPTFADTQRNRSNLRAPHKRNKTGCCTESHPLFTTSPVSEIRLITKEQVVQQLNISERKLEKMVRARDFPPPLRIGKQAQWVDTVVHKWLAKTVETQLNWEPPKRRSKYS